MKKCKTPVIYKSSALLAVNKLRKEALGTFHAITFDLNNYYKRYSLTNQFIEYHPIISDAGNINTEK